MYAIRPNGFPSLYWNNELGIMNDLNDALNRGITLFPTLETTLLTLNSFEEPDRWYIEAYPFTTVTCTLKRENRK